VAEPRLDPMTLRLYVVTSARFHPGRTHLDVARAALDGGATAIQLRAPELSGDDLREAARTISDMCRDRGVVFIVNDEADLAVGVGASGAHVGQDRDAAEARRTLGHDGILGVSVDDAAQAIRAAAAGADYLGVTVWATPTKPEAEPRGLEGVASVAAATPLPVVGIGGIDASNASEVLEAGAAGVAVVSAVAAADDPIEATRSLRSVVDAFALR
jgi:thiamine-phosphate pyrophosphorylase